MTFLLLASLATVAAPSISAADRAAGARADVRLRKSFGGRYDGAQARFVAMVGKRVASGSGLSGADGDVTVTLLDSPVENAFALPGGYVYVTRQLLALMNSEAELASVLGHEVAHVTARHAAAKSRTARIAGFLARVVDAAAGEGTLGALIGYAGRLAGSLYVFGYGRDQEYAADGLGVRYAAAAGYSPFAAATMLAQLNAATRLRARIVGRDDRVPTWAATHPDGEERVRRAGRLAVATGAVAAPAVQDVAFLRRLDGLRYDDDPGDGVVEGRTFLQPRLRFRLTAPVGYALVRAGGGVAVEGPDGLARFARTVLTNDPALAVARRFASLGLAVPAVRTGAVNGVPCAWETMPARVPGRALDVTVVVFRFATSAFRLDIVTPRGRGMGALRPLVESVASLTPAEAEAAAAAAGRRLRVVDVRPGDTVDTFAARMAYPTLRRERFLTLNGLGEDARLAPGMLVKVVTTG